MNRYGVAALCVILALLLNLGVSSLLPSSPVPGQGLHVMIVQDASPDARRDLPPAVKDAMYSTEIDSLIKSVGGKKYLVGHTQDMSSESDEWAKRAFLVPRTTLPAVVIDRDGRGEAGPLKPLPEFKVQVGKYLK